MIDAARSGARVGLALAGGGPEGSIYEIGAIRALDEALDGIDLNDLHIYVGVSAGAFISCCLANGLSTAQMCRAIVKHEPGEHPFVPETFLSPAVGEFVRGGIKVPRLFLEGVWDVLRRPRTRRLTEPLARLARALPVGIFRNDPLRVYLETIFSKPGRTDDFRKLRHPLIVVATDLDSGRSVRFGEPGLDHVPISKAVQASTALPGLYPPVKIDGRQYVDGVLLKTVHASVALEAGADLVICVNPIVPVDTVRSVELGIMRSGAIGRAGTSDGACPDLSHHHPLENGRRFVSLRHAIRRPRCARLRAPARRLQHVLFQRLLVFEPQGGLRARLSKHPPQALAEPPAAPTDSRAAWDHTPNRSSRRP